MGAVEAPDGGVEPTLPIEGPLEDPMDAAAASYGGEVTQAHAISPPLRWGVAIVLALALGLTRNDTFVATALVTVGGLLIIGVAFVAPPQRRPVLARIGLGAALIWGGWFVAFNIWELGTFLLGDNYDHPTFSTLTGPALRWFPSRVALSLLWLAIGWRALER